MNSKSGSPGKKNKRSMKPADFNDQLGENASEEFASEDYTNASKVSKKKKD